MRYAWVYTCTPQSSQLCYTSRSVPLRNRPVAFQDCVLDPRSSTYSVDYKKLRDLAKERKAHSSMKNWRE